jgi:hypothetical protein
LDFRAGFTAIKALPGGACRVALRGEQYFPVIVALRYVDCAMRCNPESPVQRGGHRTGPAATPPVAFAGIFLRYA